MFDPQPVPHAEAAAFLDGKPAVVRDVYDRLLPELRARAFTISGIESADILRAARRVIATVPQGGDWGEAKAQLEDALKPWLGGGAERRAELLLRHHAYQAYAAANVRVLDEATDLFPYRKYQTARDERVRDSHAALDGVVLPADSPFWERHTPPWAWGCRCDVVGISAEEADRLRKADARKAPERRRVLDGPVRERLESEGKLVRGVNEIYDLRTPSERGETGGPDWSPGELRLPLEMLRKRYADDPETWRAFEAWAQAQEIAEAEIEDGDGPATVWEWLAGARLRRARFRSPLLPDPEGGTLWIDDDVFEELRDAAAEKGYRRGPAMKLDPDTLAELERRELTDLRPATVEESVLLTEAGEWVKQTGLVDRVSHDETKLRGAVLSHRHPHDIAPSPEDVALLLRHRMKAVRVVASEKIYTITPGKKGPPAGFSDMDALPEFQAAHREAFATVHRVAEGYGLGTREQRETLATHLVLVGLARRGLIGYTVETK